MAVSAAAAAAPSTGSSSTNPLSGIRPVQQMLASCTGALLTVVMSTSSRVESVMDG